MSFSRRARRAVTVAALVVFALPSSAAAETAAKESLAGLWLADRTYYDPWLFAELDASSFPLLVMRGDGRFSLYRGAPKCEPLSPDGHAIDAVRSPAAYVDSCREAAVSAATEGFVSTTFRLSAAGRWEIGPDRRLAFGIGARGITPAWFPRDPAPAWLRARIEHLPSDVKNRIRFWREEQRAARRMLEMHGHRIASLYTTFFVFDGATVAYSLDQGRLTLTDARGAMLAFRAVRPEPLDAAVAILDHFGVEFRYFDCLQRRLEADWAAKSELARVAALMRRLAPRLIDMQHASALERAGRRDEADRLKANAPWVEITGVLQHPAHAAARAGRFGAYLGCPEQDER